MSKYETLTVARSDGRLIDVPYQNPVDLDALISTLENLRDLDFDDLPDGPLPSESVA